MRVRVALLVGLALAAVALTLTLSGAPSTVAGANAVPLQERLAISEGPIEICQPDESLPRDTSAVRLSLEAVIGPAITLRAFSGARLITSGTRGSGWTGVSVTVPVRALPYRARHVTLCLSVARSRIRITAIGAPASPALSARWADRRPLGGRVRSEYLHAGGTSWWSLAVSVARRMGLGREPSGTWIALLVLALMLALALLVSQLTVTEMAPRSRARGRTFKVSPRAQAVLGKVPSAAWMCAAVAGLNAVCWSFITPPFQVPDEPSHYAYVQLLAENGRLPRAADETGSPALELTLGDLHSSEVRFNPGRRSLASEAQQRTLELDQAASISQQGSGGAGAASSEPPLYYALETLPYWLASSGSLIERLELMRVLSAVMAAITALFGYLFIREALPGSRWAWTVGGLAVALFPLLGFMSGGVNPDAMQFAVCAALYYCLARAFRRGLTTRLAMLTGALTAVGLLTKLNFVGFAPGVVLGLVAVSLRTASGSASRGWARVRAVWRPLALSLPIAASPVLLYGLVNVLAGRPALGSASSVIDDLGAAWLHKLSYTWQFYLPRLPGMPNYFPGVSTWRQLWFDGLVGLYGWADTLFPGWVYDLALLPAAAIAALCVHELIRRRVALRRRVLELSVYALTGVGVMVVVGLQSYVSDVGERLEPFWEPRYLLPMIAIWGLVVALAARGAGRRWGPAVGALLIVALLAHDVFSQLQVIARYYG
jgi:Predicted membrane protein (DUF2142)